MHQAREGSISPKRFLQLFEAYGIGNIERWKYAHTFFNLSLKGFKEIEQGMGNGLTDSETDELGAALDALENDSLSSVQD